MKSKALAIALILSHVFTPSVFAASSRAVQADSLISTDRTKAFSLPAASDTLVGRASTDTLTNKTLTSPTINNGTVSGAAISGGSIDNAPIGSTTASTVKGTNITASGTAGSGYFNVVNQSANPSSPASGYSIFSNSSTQPSWKLSTGRLLNWDLSGLTADRVIALPDATTTLIGHDSSQVLTNKDIDGGTASNSRRITLPKDTLANLTALTRKAGTILYSTDQAKAYIDNGTALTAIGSGGGTTAPDGTNIVANPDFETDVSSWTASAGTLVQTTTASDVAFGGGAASWTPAASTASQTLATASMTLKAGMYNRNCMGSLAYKGNTADAANGSLRLEVTDGTNILAYGSVLPNASTYQRATVNFICPSSGSVVLRLASTVTSSASSQSAIKIDDAYTGIALNLSQVSQAQYLGTITWDSTNSWSVTNNGYSTYSAAAGNAPTLSSGATISAPATKIPGFTITNAAPGTYFMVSNGWFKAGSSGSICAWDFWDGTNASEDNQVYGINAGSALSAVPVISGHLAYTTPQSNLTVQIRGGGVGGSSICAVGVGTSPQTQSISVYYYPSQSQTGYRPDQTPASWSGTQVGDGGGWSTTSTSYGDFSVATTSNTVTPTGTPRNITCVAESTKLPAITCTLPRVGNYFACGSLSFSGSGGTGATNVRLVDGSGTIINGGQQANAVAGGTGYGATLCGLETVSSLATATTFKIQGLAASSQTTTISQSSNAPITWSIVELDAPMAAPYLQNQISSNTSGQERIERATVTMSSCTAAKQSGSWITSPGTHNGAGDCSFTIASNEFSDTPTCTCSYGAGTPSTQLSCAVSTVAESSTSLRIVTNNGGTNTDGIAKVICMGPR